MSSRTLTFLAVQMILTSAFAQKHRPQAHASDDRKDMYLPVKCNVTANGARTGDVTTTVYKDNAQVVQLTPEKKKSGFLLELDLDSYYTIRVNKVGYREKTVYVDTHLPKGQTVYSAYECFVNLEAMEKFTHGDPYYLDFPSAIVRWNAEKKAFTHTDGYLANIQLKMALLAAQVETK